MKKVFSKRNILIVSVIIVIVVLSLFLVNKGSIHTKGVRVYYRTYTKEKGWTSWKKNGQISGDKKHNITAIEMKVKSKSKGYIFYNLYTDDWQINNCSDKIVCGDINGEKASTALKVMASDTLFKKYNTNYRIYTKNNKWSNYSKDFEVSGSEKGDNYITAIQIKVENKK